ncbi:ML domain-containing protein [Gongronella butleri]|nr:ML domain-containing protein [Gongronella butleri]
MLSLYPFYMVIMLSISSPRSAMARAVKRDIYPDVPAYFPPEMREFYPDPYDFQPDLLDFGPEEMAFGPDGGPGFMASNDVDMESNLLDPNNPFANPDYHPVEEDRRPPPHRYQQGGERRPQRTSNYGYGARPLMHHSAQVPNGQHRAQALTPPNRGASPAANWRGPAIPPWISFCNGNSKPLISVEHVAVKPETLKAGQRVSVYAQGEIRRALQTGSYVTISAKKGIFTVFNKTIDLCHLLAKVKSTCPVRSGPFVFDKAFNIPSFIPSGHYDLTAHVYTASHEEATCLKIKLTLT